MQSLEAAVKEYDGEFRSLTLQTPWETVPEEYRNEVLARAEEYAAQPYPMRRATDFLAFVRSGSRQADEEPYFFRRRKLCWEAAACGMGKVEYLDDVVDGIWCVCEETSWVISAHNVNPIPGAPAAAEFPLPEAEDPYVDLFAAQTGMILTLVRHMLGRDLDGISPVLGRRISREIRRRILDPFLQRDDFWWMGFLRKDLCNWTPWIVSNVMCCALYEPLTEEERRQVMIRACGMLDRWLDVVPADGGCDEGAGYWNMAGGALLDCLELLEEATGGRMAFWDEYKLQNILKFPWKMEIGGGWFANFADCDARPLLSGERLQYAGEKIGDSCLVEMGVRLRGKLADQLEDVPHFSRLLKMLFHLPVKPIEVITSPGLWLPDLQVRMVRKEGWTLYCKGGHNGESHNHNDVGSFLLFLNGEPEIVDAGNMTYTAKTFSAARYTLWNTRSAYHNVPMIGKYEQQAGREYAASHPKLLSGGLTLEIGGAYPKEAGVKTLRRELSLSEGGLRLRDQVSLRDPLPVTWAFLLRNQPVFTRDVLTAGGIQIRCFGVHHGRMEEIPITDERMAKNYPGSLWRVCLTADPDREMDAIFIVERRGGGLKNEPSEE